jgi:CheY-like chemotaxis protein
MNSIQTIDPPRAPEADNRQKHLADDRRPAVGRQPEVLVADDNPAVLLVVEMALQSAGFAVRTAATGEEAVRLFVLHRGSIDVVLLDVRMPGMDGPQTLAALREIDPGVRCVFMTGDAAGHTGEQLLALGATGLLQKPFASMDELVQVLRQVTAAA